MTDSLQVIDKMRVSASTDPNTILTEIVVPWQERAPRTYSGLVPTNLALSFQPFVLRNVLVQPEMENWRYQSASIPPFSVAQLGGKRPMQVCVVMARATFRQRPPTRGIRAPASDRRRPELLQ